MLADPGFVEAEPVQPLHQFEIAIHAGGGVLVHRMERRQKDTVAKLDHGHRWGLWIGLAAFWPRPPPPARIGHQIAPAARPRSSGLEPPAASEHLAPMP